MTRNYFLKALFGAIATCVSGVALAQSMAIGAMPVGSGWYVGAAAYKKAIESSGSSLKMEVVARGGGVANPMVVEQKKVDVAISNVATSQWAREGILLR